MAWPDMSDLRTRVRDLLNESTSAFFSDAEINRWLNDGERDIAIKSLCLEQILSKATVSGTRTVDIYHVKTLDVEYTPAAGNPVGLLKIIPKQLGHLNLNGTHPQYWFPWGKTIAIEPLPDAAYNLKVYVASLPTIEMSETTDEPQIPVSLHYLVIKYAYCRALMKDGLLKNAGFVYANYVYDLENIRSSIVEKYQDRKSEYKLPDRIEIKE